MNVVIGLVLIGVFASLGSALFYMVSPAGRDSNAMAKALTVRISLSVALFVLLMGLWLAGFIDSEQIHHLDPLRRHPLQSTKQQNQAKQPSQNPINILHNQFPREIFKYFNIKLFNIKRFRFKIA